MHLVSDKYRETFDFEEVSAPNRKSNAYFGLNLLNRPVKMRLEISRLLKRFFCSSQGIGGKYGIWTGFPKKLNVFFGLLLKVNP